MKKTVFLLIITTLFISTASCSKQEYYEYEMYAMDTVITFRVENCSEAEKTVAGCERLINSIDRTLSLTNASSDAGRFNESDTGIEDASEMTVSIVREALKLSALTGGLYDITVGGLVSLWDVAHGDKTVPAEDEIAEALTTVGYEKISVDGSGITKTCAETMLDLGSIGKGYTLDAVVGLLKDSPVSYGVVSIGGNIGVFGEKPDGEKWKVGVKNPRATGKTVGYFEISSGFISTSGDYERYFEVDGVRYHHIINPKSGYPENNGTMSVAVWCESGMIGDGLSTALFLLGEDSQELRDAYNYKAVFITEDGISCTDGTEEIFINEG